VAGVAAGDRAQPGQDVACLLLPVDEDLAGGG
jgi:hypothetical protein